MNAAAQVGAKSGARVLAEERPKGGSGGGLKLRVRGCYGWHRDINTETKGNLTLISHPCRTTPGIRARGGELPFGIKQTARF